MFPPSPSASSTSSRGPSARGHHRRKSSVGTWTARFLSDHSSLLSPSSASVAVQSCRQGIASLSPIIDTPSSSSDSPPVTATATMPLSRSPSPNPEGGWSSPGLDINSGRSTPVSGFPTVSGGSPAWDAVKMRNAKGGTSPFSSQNRGFLTQHMRRISNSLPTFSSSSASSFAEDKQSGPARWSLRNLSPGKIMAGVARMGRKAKIRLFLFLLVLAGIIIFYEASLLYYWRRTPWLGGGQKFVIILAANVGGGVMEWKGAREWAIERDSVRNKRKYVARWGYELEIVDMITKKRYAHEWREGWEKVDFIRSSLRKYPKAEWIWWLDLNTYIMEPSYSLQSHIFDQISKHVYRDINVYNPLNITHPFTDIYLDADSASPVGDGRAESVNLMLSQDCSGFNLGSFFIRRSVWTERLLDVWWDPVAYEQKHMEWEHKEQDALEQLYSSQPWVRKHTAFLPQRMVNSFPAGACSENGEDGRIHYNQKGRDFVVNMAGCEWGRDCWGEMYYFRELGYYLNRNPWERFKEDLIAVIWFKLTGRHVRL